MEEALTGFQDQGKVNCLWKDQIIFTFWMLRIYGTHLFNQHTNLGRWCWWYIGRCEVSKVLYLRVVPTSPGKHFHSL